MALSASMSTLRSRAQVLAFRAAAMLAVIAAIATGVAMALSQAPTRAGLRIAKPPHRRTIRSRPRVILAQTDAGGAEPVAMVIPPAEEVVWPPPLLNPEAHLRMAWDLSMGRPNSHEVLFSFDDGPNPGTTDRLLPMLAAADIRAVFFVCGWRLETEEPIRSRARKILQDIAAAGHIVGNHTVHHHNLPTLSPERIRYEIDHNADLIEEVTGERPHMFRPPYGAYNEDVRRHVTSLHNEMWLWSIDPHDYLVVGDSETVAQRVIMGIANHAGGTVLIHDTHAWSVAAVPKILRWIRESNRERLDQGRPVYEIMDAPRYLEGARVRLEAMQAPATVRSDAGAHDVHDAGDAVVDAASDGVVRDVSDAAVVDASFADTVGD
jgi:peptidoglycan/xylan/chitin deacetylase (PgdA/CDA1 family)